MTGINKIEKGSSQKFASKKAKTMLDVVEAAKEEISRQFPGFSSYHALKLAKLLTENKDIIK